MNNIKNWYQIIIIIKREVVFRAILILDLLNKTLHIIAFSISMETLLSCGNN